MARVFSNITPKSDSYSDYIEDVCVGPKRLVRIGVKTFQPGAQPYVALKLFKRDSYDPNMDYTLNGVVSLTLDEFTTVIEKISPVYNLIDRAYSEKEKKAGTKRIIKRGGGVAKKPRADPVVIKEEPVDNTDETIQWPMDPHMFGLVEESQPNN
jgi:hypothetical protein